MAELCVRPDRTTCGFYMFRESDGGHYHTDGSAAGPDCKRSAVCFTCLGSLAAELYPSSGQIKARNVHTDLTPADARRPEPGQESRCRRNAGGIMEGAKENTDRELWRGKSDAPGDPDNFYADSVSVTEDGAIAIQSRGLVVVKTPKEWVKAGGSLPHSAGQQRPDDAPTSWNSGEMAPSSLFQLGDFTLHSGAHSDLKIKCDALTDGDLAALAKVIAEHVPPFGHLRSVTKVIAEHVPPFGHLRSVPRGGDRLSAALEPYKRDGCDALLIVDDVLTTGASMEEARPAGWNGPVYGAVIFARGPCPDWVWPVMTFAGDDPKKIEEGRRKGERRVHAAVPYHATGRPTPGHYQRDGDDTVLHRNSRFGSDRRSSRRRKL